MFGLLCNVEHAHVLHHGALGEFAQGGVADTSCGIVDDTDESLVVFGIDGQPEVGDGIFDLLALVEGHTSVDTVGDAEFAELVLKGA